MARTDEAAPPTDLIGASHGDRTPHDPGRIPASEGQLWWWVTAVVAVATSAYLHWTISLSATAPRTPWDEVHPLHTARLLAGQSDLLPLSGSGYYPGWALLIAPVWWFTDDAQTVYDVAVQYSNVLALATIIPLAWLARRMGLGLPQAIVAAAIPLSLPGRTVLADYALSEQALLFVLAWTVLAMHALWRRPSWWRLALFVLGAASCYLVHSRGLAVVATAAVWLLLLTVRRWRIAIPGLILLTAAALTVRWFAEGINDTILLPGEGKEDLLRNVLEPGNSGLFVRVLINQSWAQAVGTGGLAVLGAVVILVWAWREVRRWRIGPGVFLLGLCLSALLLSAIWWTRPDLLWVSQPNPRLDAWIYTRYVDHVAAFLVLIALVVIIRRVRLGPVLAALGLFTVVALAVVLWIAQDIALWGTLYGPGNSSALLSWSEWFTEQRYPLPQQPTFTNENSFWVWASLFCAVCLAIITIARRWPRVLVSALLSLALVLSLQADPDQRRDAPRRMERAVEQIESVTGDGLIDIDMDYSCMGPALTREQTLNWVGYWFSPRDIDFTDPAAGIPFDSPYVISCEEWPDAERYGARRVTESRYYTYSLWVLPGDEQRELESAGLLDP